MSTDAFSNSVDQALSSAELIARWDIICSGRLDQRSILSKLCGECIATFRKLLVSATVKDRTAPYALRNLDRSRCTLSLWADAYRVCEGGLDEAADESRYLRKKLLQILTSIAATLSERLLPKLRVQDAIPTDQLDDWRREALAATQQDYRDREAYDSTSESDGSDSDISISNDLDDIIESLETDTQLLMELDRFIQMPFMVITATKEVENQIVTAWQPQDAFAQIIRTRFPEALDQLVDSLAQANLARMKRCAEAREAQEHDQNEATALMVKPAPTIGGATQDDSGYRTMTATSARIESDQARSRYAETVMSYAAGDYTIKIPPLPSGARTGKPFECLICGKRVSFTSKRMWKRHLFSDLQPWTCIEPHCASENKTFNTQETWVQHLEFDHEYGPSWQSRPCPLCKEDIGAGVDTCSKHLSAHLEEISLATLPRHMDEDEVSQLSISSDSSASSIIYAGSSHQVDPSVTTPRQKGGSEQTGSTISEHWKPYTNIQEILDAQFTPSDPLELLATSPKNLLRGVSEEDVPRAEFLRVNNHGSKFSPVGDNTAKSQAGQQIFLRKTATTCDQCKSAGLVCEWQPNSLSTCLACRRADIACVSNPEPYLWRCQEIDCRHIPRAFPTVEQLFNHEREYHSIALVNDGNDLRFECPDAFCSQKILWKGLRHFRLHMMVLHNRQLTVHEFLSMQRMRPSQPSLSWEEQRTLLEQIKRRRLLILQQPQDNANNASIVPPQHGEAGSESRPWQCPVSACEYHEHGWSTEEELNGHVRDNHLDFPREYARMTISSGFCYGEVYPRTHAEKTEHHEGARGQEQELNFKPRSPRLG